MLDYLRDKLRSARLNARYQRIVQERVLDLVEAQGPQPVFAEDPGQWLLVGDGGQTFDQARLADVRGRARRLVAGNPHARNILRLLEIYVAGPGLKLAHVPRNHDQPASQVAEAADALWEQFLEDNRRHFSFGEYARRAWRDGECFLRKFPRPDWPPTVRFVDPEAIAAPREFPDSQGILTDPRDVERITAYLRVDPQSGELLEQIAGDDVLHTRVGVDSNQKRGLTMFAPVLDALGCFEKWMETEMRARKLQASIVLWRKVQGSPTQATAAVDAAQSSLRTDPTGQVRRERYRPGTILTTSQGTELQFLQPNTNFGDAVPLGRLVLLCIAAGAGIPEFMLSSDASNANFASTMVAEGPAVKLFQSEQQFFAAEFQLLWRWLMAQAVQQGRLPSDFFSRVAAHWSFPQLVNRDRARERTADVRLVEQQILSRAEVARRDGADPAAMRSEIEDELGREET